MRKVGELTATLFWTGVRYLQCRRSSTSVYEGDRRSSEFDEYLMLEIYNVLKLYRVDR